MNKILLHYSSILLGILLFTTIYHLTRVPLHIHLDTLTKDEHIRITKQTKVTATIYKPTEGETSGSQFKTATGAIIDSLHPEKHRWVAISRDLLKKYKYGDTIIVSNAKKFNGKWVIQDCMGKHHKKRIDFLVGFDEPLGKLNNVIIRKKK